MPIHGYLNTTANCLGLSKTILEANIKMVLTSCSMQAVLFVEPRLRGKPRDWSQKGFHLEPRWMSLGVVLACFYEEFYSKYVSCSEGLSSPDTYNAQYLSSDSAQKRLNRLLPFKTVAIFTKNNLDLCIRNSKDKLPGHRMAFPLK